MLFISSVNNFNVHHRFLLCIVTYSNVSIGHYKLLQNMIVCTFYSYERQLLRAHTWYIFGNISHKFLHLFLITLILKISLWKIYQKVVIINKFWKQFRIKVKSGSEELDSVQYSHTKIHHYEENLNIMQYIIQLLYQ